LYNASPDFTADKYEAQDGLYFSNGNIVIPNSPELKQHIIHECHDSMFAGHMGRDKTLATVKRLFHWRNMHDDVEQYVKSCHVCQTVKPTATGHHGLLHPIEVAERPWQNISGRSYHRFAIYHIWS
jgi:hypothetical protein